jgi:hypothetical protein
MLEFIVLGIIPGTEIQLSPFGVVLLWLGLALTGRSLLHLHNSHKLMEKYEEHGIYFTLITKKHRITRRLKG